LISTTATTPSSRPTRIEPIASGVGESVSWCSPRPGAGDQQAEQRGRILGEDRPQGRVGRRQHVLDEVAVERGRLRLGLPDGLAERHPLQHEGHGQH